MNNLIENYEHNHNYNSIKIKIIRNKLKEAKDLYTENYKTILEEI